MKAKYPILEFDNAKNAIIEPSKVLKSIPGIPEHCVLPMYHTVIEQLRMRKLLTHVTNIETSMGSMPVYRMSHKGIELAITHPGICAPFVAAVLEELIVIGCRKFIACGSAGVLDKSLAKGTVVVPNAAIRDEGTSYHYLAPSREIKADPQVIAAIESVLQGHGIRYQVGKTWTTDGIYRETKGRIAKRKSEKCLTVEMECSAFIAVARFRRVRFGQILATGDDISGDEWDPRHTDGDRSFPEKLFWLSVEACLRL